MSEIQNIMLHRTSRWSMLASIAAMALTGSAVAQTPEAPEATPAVSAFAMNDEVRTQVRAIRGLSLSPDGKSVIAGITDTTANGGQPHLWLLAEGARPRQLTFSRTADRGGETSADFAPNGTSVTFLASRDGTRSLFRLPLTGGEPERLQIVRAKSGATTASWGGTKPADAEALAVGGYAWSPDGRYLALWADEPELAAAKARKDRKDDGYSHGEADDRTRLYLIDPATGAVRAVPLSGTFQDVHWSYDSADMLVATDPDSDELGPDTTIWRIAPADLATTKLDLPKSAADAAYLPGRTRLVYTEQCADDAPPRCNDLIVKDLATGTARNLTRGIDGAIPGSFIVLPDGDLMMTIATHFQSRLARLSTRTGKVTWLDSGKPVTSGLVTNQKQTGWAMTSSSATDPTGVYLAKRPGTAPARLETPALVPAHWAKVPSQIVSWQNEGLTIEAALYMPRVPAGTKVPLVVSIHGGPAGRFQDDYSALIQMLVAEGWAVMQPNIRGSTGYGAKFTAANKNDLGGADYRDVMTGVDTVLRDHPIDANRMALIGYSYGGEMAGFAVGKTDRFKAIVSGAPVINQFSEYGTERGTWYDRWYYGRPWDNFEDAWRQSPIAYAKNARTPFLLLQGSEDVTDPLGQSIEMYRALRQYDAPVALVVYPREGHGETGGNFRALPSTEPWHGVDLRRRMFGFLRAAFAGEPDPLAIAHKDVVEPAK